MIEVINLFFQA